MQKKIMWHFVDPRVSRIIWIVPKDNLTLTEILLFIADDDEDGEHRLTLSGGEDDEAEEKEDEKWRVERLEREKWMQGERNLVDLMRSCLRRRG